jgi:hypothetical protein
VGGLVGGLGTASMDSLSFSVAVPRLGAATVMDPNYGKQKVVTGVQLPISERRNSNRFAGRSAIRRMRYGYHWLPNGT